MRRTPKNVNGDLWADPGEAGDNELLNSVQSSLPVEASLPSYLRTLTDYHSGACGGLFWGSCLRRQCWFLRTYPRNTSLLLELWQDSSPYRPQKVRSKVWLRRFTVLRTNCTMVPVCTDTSWEWVLGCGIVMEGTWSWTGGNLLRWAHCSDLLDSVLRLQVLEKGSDSLVWLKHGPKRGPH